MPNVEGGWAARGRVEQGVDRQAVVRAGLLFFQRPVLFVSQTATGVVGVSPARLLLFFSYQCPSKSMIDNGRTNSFARKRVLLTTITAAATCARIMLQRGPTQQHRKVESWSAVCKWNTQFEGIYSHRRL